MPSVKRSDLPALEEAYKAALAAGLETFEFNGATLLTSYAKYLIEYLRGL